ncbi:hypothetical protein [Pseudoalteromonas denitrificans]|uniref:Polyketide cyclase / dehydrase and lipid transport n=1 Tax=Pseudoalteromonas denitrificans DSM 6059 TaxID=1123010 RepID=A0A1I1LE33_9GAMM|nr:hypothetical protein [Pseudoalteromonas denitrificans]SFC71354.1 hypothetical protein SAMN02745724_02338 [Pseudoalteromonas denitrificans DSM 6059]
METVNQIISLNASKQDAWNVLADFGNAHKYSKGITNSHLMNEVETDVGTTGYCDLPPVMSME